MTPTKHRFVTRADFDGLACAVMLSELDLIDEVVFVHAQDVLDGPFEIISRDITANLPRTVCSSTAPMHSHAIRRTCAIM
jgi:hypothetical protein